MAGPKFLYKIRNKKTGEFSKGGITPKFGKVGKVWKHAGHIKNHLSQFDVIPEEWEVLVYPIQTDPVKVEAARDFIKNVG